MVLNRFTPFLQGEWNRWQGELGQLFEGFADAGRIQTASRMKRVVITGLGAITCIGSSTEGLWQGILRGESGIRRRAQPSLAQGSR